MRIRTDLDLSAVLAKSLLATKPIPVSDSGRVVGSDITFYLQLEGEFHRDDHYTAVH